MKVGEKREIEVYGEICCDYCGEIIHNHFDCPVCEAKYTATDCYYNLSESYYSDEAIIDCAKCKSKFKLVEGNAYFEGIYERIS
jgi:hypothetical protein